MVTLQIPLYPLPSINLPSSQGEAFSMTRAWDPSGPQGARTLSTLLPWEAKEVPAVSPGQPGGPVSPSLGVWVALSWVSCQVVLILFKYPHLLNGA